MAAPTVSADRRRRSSLARCRMLVELSFRPNVDQPGVSGLVRNSIDKFIARIGRLIKSRYFTTDYETTSKISHFCRKARTARLPQLVNLYYDHWVDQTARVRTEV